MSKSMVTANFPQIDMVLSHQMVTFSLWRGFSWSWIGLLPLQYLSSICLQVKVGVISHDQNIPNPVSLSSAQELSTEIYTRRFILFFHFMGYVNFVCMSSCKILQRDILGICEVITCRFAEYVGLCCIPAVTCSAFSCVQTERAGLTDLFTTVP